MEEIYGKKEIVQSTEGNHLINTERKELIDKHGNVIP
jgi:hypothetical protein